MACYPSLWKDEHGGDVSLFYLSCPVCLNKTLQIKQNSKGAKIKQVSHKKTQKSLVSLSDVLVESGQ